MLHVILLILKILGLALLLLLGLILAAVLLLLFVPVRYQFDGSLDGAPSGKAAVSWLFHLVSAAVSYEGKAVLALRVLGFPVWKKQVWPEEDDLDEPEEAEGSESFEGPGPAGLDHMGGQEKEEKAGGLQGWETGPGPSGDEGEGGEAPGGPGQGPEEEDEEILVHTTEIPAQVPVRVCIWEKAKKFIDGLWGRLKKFVEDIRRRLARSRRKVKSWKASFEKAKAFFQNEENQKTIKLLFTQAKKMFRHVLPRKIQGRIRFGFDDPYRTGQLLTAASPFYGLYAKSLVLEPVFDEAVLEGELHVKGRIRAASLLWIVLRVWLDKNFRKLLKKWR